MSDLVAMLVMFNVNAQGINLDGGGTLGGFACLTIKNHVHRGWMTCHHVIRNDDLDAKESLLESKFGYGSKESRPLPHPTIQYPASADLDLTRYTQLIKRNNLKHKFLQIDNAKTLARFKNSLFPCSQAALINDLITQYENGLKSRLKLTKCLF